VAQVQLLVGEPSFCNSSPLDYSKFNGKRILGSLMRREHRTVDLLSLH
jgi:hypothetical protein